MGRNPLTYLNVGCTDCSGGKYRQGAENGGPEVDYCMACDSGKYSNDGANACSDAPSGKYADNSERSESDLKVCAPGRYSEGGATSCTPCPAGTYNSASGWPSSDAVASAHDALDKCQACPAGTYMLGTGATACDDCQLGYYQSGNACSKCQLGKYQDATKQTECKVCGTGHIATALGQTACDSCPPGKYNQYDETYAASHHQSCTDCKKTDKTLTPPEPGEYQAQSGQDSCNDCLDPKLALTTGSAQCTTCDKVGDYSTGSGCLACPAGKYSNSDTGYECWHCPAGTWFAGSGAGLEKNPMTDGNVPDTDCRGKQLPDSPCRYCPAGTVSSDLPNIADDLDVRSKVCMDDDPDDATTSSCNNDAAKCTACPHGKYNDKGDSLCYGCEAGKYNDASMGIITNPARGLLHEKTSGGDECKDCAAGKFSETNAQVECTDCVAGKIQSSTGKEICTDCQPGQYTPSGVGAIACRNCPAGAFSTNAGLPVAADLNPPDITNSYGTTISFANTACQECDAGYSSNAGDRGCFEIPKGSTLGSCPEYDTNNGITDTKNICTYLYGGHWNQILESGSSPFGATCSNYTVCGRLHGKFMDAGDRLLSSDLDPNSRKDEYYVMCNECADGYAPASMNSQGQWEEVFIPATSSDAPTYCETSPDEVGCLNKYENVCDADTKPIYCYKKTDLRVCMNPYPTKPVNMNNVEQSCKYFYQGDWMEVSAGARSPYFTVNDMCSQYTVCGLEQEETGVGDFVRKKDTFRVVCDSCRNGYAGGMTSTTLEWPMTIVDVDGKLGTCDLNTVSYPSMCYNKNESFVTCPSLPTATDSDSSIGQFFPSDFTSQDCEYFYESSWDEVDPGGTSPFDTSCAEYEMCDVTEEGPPKNVKVKTSFKIACSKCATGYLPSKPATNAANPELNTCKNDYYPTKCYQHTPPVTDWKKCFADPEQAVSCKYWKTPGTGTVVEDGQASSPQAAVWESESEGNDSPFYYDAVDKINNAEPLHVCATYKMCHSKIHDPIDNSYMNKDDYYLVCTQCANGYYPTVVDDKPVGAAYGNCGLSDQLVIAECSRIPTASPTPSPTSSFVVPPAGDDDEQDQEVIEPDEKDTGGGGEENEFRKPEGLTDKLKAAVGDNTPLVIGGFIALCIGCGFCALKGGCSFGGGGVQYDDEEEGLEYDYDSETDDSSRYTNDSGSSYSKSMYSRGSSSSESQQFDYKNPMRETRGKGGRQSRGGKGMRVNSEGLLEMGNDQL